MNVHTHKYLVTCIYNLFHIIIDNDDIYQHDIKNWIIGISTVSTAVNAFFVVIMIITCVFCTHDRRKHNDDVEALKKEFAAGTEAPKKEAQCREQAMDQAGKACAIDNYQSGTEYVNAFQRYYRLIYSTLVHTDIGNDEEN